MRWFGFVVLVLLTVVVQLAAGRTLGLGSQRIMPDLFLMWAVVLAFRGPAPDVLVGCWFLGLAKDLTSQSSLGSYALSFGFIGMVIVYLRELFYGDHPMTLILLAFFGSLCVEHLCLLINSFKGDFDWSGYGPAALTILFSGVFTAGLSPYGQWLLLKLHRQIGLPRRRSYSR